jgi:cleavage stimulation factor subunit 1
MDGSIKIWDGVSGDCIRTFENAHKGAAVVSCEITNNNKYILTSGLDSIVRLWDISSGKLS